MKRFATRLSALLVALAFSGSAARADYLYTVSGLPAPIVNGQSIVVFSVNPPPIHPLPGTTSADLTVANVIGFSANQGVGDHFNTPFTLNVDFTDPAKPGSDVTASFTGTLAGTLALGQSSLFVTFSGPPQHVSFGGNTYAVSMATPSTQVSSAGVQKPLSVHVAFTGRASDTPEPSTLVLGGIAALGLVRLRRQRRA